MFSDGKLFSLKNVYTTTSQPFLSDIQMLPCLRCLEDSSVFFLQASNSYNLKYISR